MTGKATEPAYYLLLTTYDILHTTYDLRQTIYHLQLTTYYLLLITYYLQLTAYILLTAYYLLVTTYYLLLTTYHLILTTYSDGDGERHCARRHRGGCGAHELRRRRQELGGDRELGQACRNSAHAHQIQL